MKLTQHCKSTIVQYKVCLCVCVCVCVRVHTHAGSVVSDSLRPHGLLPTRLLCPWNSPGKKTRVGCHFFLQGVLSTQGSNSCLLCLLYWQVDSLPLCHQGSPHLINKSWHYCLFFLFFNLLFSHISCQLPTPSSQTSYHPKELASQLLMTPVSPLEELLFILQNPI